MSDQQRYANRDSQKQQPPRVAQLTWTGSKGGGLSTHQLVREHAQRPPIHRAVVSLVADDLWCEVVGGAAKGPGAVLDDLRKSKVDELEVALAVEE